MSKTPLKLSRDQILAFRRHVGALDHRLPAGADSLRQAAWAGLQDSMPRAALLSIGARISGTQSTVLDDPTLTQVWGPRYSSYAVALADVPIFTLSRLPDEEKGRLRAQEMADRLERFLEGRRMKDREVGAALRTGNAMRYATTTGRILIRWEGALAPTMWTVAAPDISVAEARREMARRYLHVFGPATAASFAKWAGISLRAGIDTFEALAREVIGVDTPFATGTLLATDEEQMRAKHDPPAEARLLPSGDTFFLVWGHDRELVVPDPARRAELWTPRVWPGALLVNGEVSGVWRRSNEKVLVSPWRQLTPEERDAVETEARLMPLPSLTRPITVSWS